MSACPQLVRRWLEANKTVVKTLAVRGSCMWNFIELWWLGVEPLMKLKIAKIPKPWPFRRLKMSVFPLLNTGKTWYLGERGHLPIFCKMTVLIWYVSCSLWPEGRPCWPLVASDGDSKILPDGNWECCFVQGKSRNQQLVGDYNDEKQSLVLWQYYDDQWCYIYIS